MKTNRIRIELGGDEAVIEVNGVQLHHVGRIVLEPPKEGRVSSVQIEFDVIADNGIDTWGSPS